MAQFLKHFVQDLQQDIKIRQCGTIVFKGDNKSNVITVELYNGQEPYAGGGTVSGACICPDGATVPLTNGTLSGNTVTLRPFRQASFSAFIPPLPQVASHRYCG